MLLSKLVKAKYFRRKPILETEQKATDSYAWNSLCSVFDIVINGLDGDRTNPECWKWKYGASGNYSVNIQWLITGNCFDMVLEVNILIPSSINGIGKGLGEFGYRIE